MNAELERYLRDQRIQLDGESFTVPVPMDRMQTVRILEQDGITRLSSVIATSRMAERSPIGPLQLMRQNRYSELVEFTIGRRGRWIAQTVLPPGPLAQDEIAEYIRALVNAADRMEQIVSGKDVH